jgi:hypothetical protein
MSSKRRLRRQCNRKKSFDTETRSYPITATYVVSGTSATHAVTEKWSPLDRSNVKESYSRP